MKYSLDEIKRLVKKYNNRMDGYFFPTDIIPHSRKLRYACNKYYKQGLLIRRGEQDDRWGYMYKLKDDSDESP